jgi:Asp-tRNA(Asn)/Glu-tRNA(Gln) amidotransferase A subunit family amidase
LSAAEQAAAAARGEVSALALTEACLQRIAERDEQVQAWAFLDPDHARAQAKGLDERRKRGLPLGPLHGVPVGIKDIIDTRDMPTEHGTVLHAGRRPRTDAWLVARLRAAGAVILGKTVTTELAVFSPNATRNPHDLARTPGGSSSGSAAAVADGMVPLAVGTQTNGSVIRPASFCGVYGFKPTFGRIPRTGVLRQSPPLDTIGVFAASIEDAALLADVLFGNDPADPATLPEAMPALRRVALAEPPVTPSLGFVRTPVWDQAEATTREAFAELQEALGARIEMVPLPPLFDDVIELHRTIMEADLARSFADEVARGRDRLSDILIGMIERGQRVLAVDYNRAVDRRAALNAALAPLFERYDALLTPATLGEAPLGLESTGSPVFCTAWTLTGTPAVTLPLLQGPAGLPLGAQLVGRRGDDARLLRTARWLETTLRS